MGAGRFGAFACQRDARRRGWLSFISNQVAAKQFSHSLNDRQQRFVTEYVVDLNATRAYLRAGYKSKTDQAAASEASRLVRTPKVAAAIQERMRRNLTAADLTPERIMRELARIGLHDIRKLYDENGDLKPVKDLGDDEAAAISSIESSTSRSLEAASR